MLNTQLLKSKAKFDDKKKVFKLLRYSEYVTGSIVIMYSLAPNCPFVVVN